MVLTECHTILLGAMFHIHTDHLNITTNNSTPDCVIHWINYVSNSTLTFTLFPAKTMSLPNCSLGLTTLKNLFCPRTSKYLFSKIPSQKGLTLLRIHSSSSAYTYYHFQSVIQTPLIINGSLTNTMKLMK